MCNSELPQCHVRAGITKGEVKFDCAFGRVEPERDVNTSCALMQLLVLLQELDITLAIGSTGTCQIPDSYEMISAHLRKQQLQKLQRESAK